MKKGKTSKKFLIEVGQINMRKCKEFYKANPFTTKTYMCLKTGVNMTFVSSQWDTIISE